VEAIQDVISNNYTITLEEKPDAEDTQFVSNALAEFNRQQVGRGDNHQRLAIFIRDGDNKIAGGLLGDTYWGWLYIGIFWLERELRGQGYGQRLLSMAEAEAIRRGCHSAHLDTMSFQARPFYEKYGYRVYGQLDDMPTGHTRYFMQKSLRPAV
jgi:GNAT superfamily N-acetyltransferase